MVKEEEGTVYSCCQLAAVTKEKTGLSCPVSLVVAVAWFVLVLHVSWSSVLFCVGWFFLQSDKFTEKLDNQLVTRIQHGGDGSAPRAEAAAPLAAVAKPTQANGPSAVLDELERQPTAVGVCAAMPAPSLMGPACLPWFLFCHCTCCL